MTLHHHQIRQLKQVDEGERFGHVFDPAGPWILGLQWAHKDRLMRIILIDRKTCKVALTDKGKAALQPEKQTA